LESELFGHEKGAFTGAQESRAGRFEQANGGTLFLDEAGNLSAAIQKKLLGVLQDFTITRLGGNRPIRLDIRLIAASNIPLLTLVKNGGFREDLYFRINTILLVLPPLSERPEDIPPLCEHFIASFNAGGGKTVQGLTAGAYKKLYGYSWPGNVRELRSVIQRAHIFCEKDWIDENLIELPREAGHAADSEPSSKKSYHLKGMTRQKFIALIKKHGGVVSGVARALCISRKACYDNFARYEVDIKSFRSS
jgi:DNA-binding NtrC family response regulator